MLERISDLRFASDATLYGLWGGALLLLALIAMWAETRRIKRKAIDRVGWMPWTKLFFVCALAGLTLLVMAIAGWTAPEPKALEAGFEVSLVETELTSFLERVGAQA
jgi:uncharacterized membrane protein